MDKASNQNSKHLQEILVKFVEGSATSEELQFLQYWEEHIDQHKNEFDQLDTAEKQSIEQTLKVRIFGNLPKAQDKIRFINRYWHVAASIILLFSIATITYFTIRDNKSSQSLTSKYGEDVMPGQNLAYITLSDGSKYQLKEDRAGITMDKNGITYQDGGLIASTDAIVTATINVPRAGTYRITLADGTKIILNSESSLQYPTSFAGSERKVQLQGEAYFEVAADPNKPFLVSTGDQELKVLGTHFNIQAYPNEAISTTLLEGSVALTANKKTLKLKPGQQAVLKREDFNVSEVTVDDYTAWTRNLFTFNMIPLRDIFQQMERWYDVDIDYPASLANEKYFMEIPKDRKLSEVLSSLSSLTGIKFKIVERRVTVQP